MAEQASVPRLPPRDRLVLFVAEGFGLGRVSRMPGTLGSLWGLPLGWFLIPLNTSGRLLVGLVMLLVGIPLCGRAARLRGSADPASVVWDEIAAFPLVYAFVPLTWKTLLLGFVLFRLFDITKPPPIRRAERIGGGAGIMADDIVAAAWAQIPLLLTVYAAGWV